MASRTWLAVVLCCLVWFVHMRWFAPQITPPTTNPAVESTPGTAATPATTAAGSSNAKTGLSASTLPQVTETIDTAKASVGFSDIGGQIALVDLKEYHRTIKRDSLPIQLIHPDSAPLTGATLFTDPKLQGFSDAVYRRDAKDGKVLFSSEKDGVTVDKEYQLGSDPYRFPSKFTIRFSNAGAKRDWGYLYVPLGRTSVEFSSEDPLRSWEVVSYINDSIERQTTEKMEQGEKVLQGPVRWVSFGNRYFVTAAIHGAEINPDIVYAKNGKFTGAYLRYPIVLKSGQNEISFPIEFFYGPKEYTELAKIPGMKKLIDYGMFSIFAFPLLELLRFFYRFIHNYGIAIILLTVLVRILFYPLSLKSSRSMKAMQKLQPQIAALKEKYKDDTQKFGQEQMALFRQHKVNPAGGCLPMLVQLPVFIALYAVLGNSLELFHAPFFGWIQDLSAKDPWYVFPVLMGISMLVQQKMTPAAGMDEMQKKMLMLMPIVFTFVMLNLPSGLTIYIFLSTLLGILQQVIINREKDPAGLLVAKQSN